MGPLHEQVLRKYKPARWGEWDGTEEAQQIVLEKTSKEYKRVAKTVLKDFKINIESIERIENPFLLGFYQLKKAEYKTFMKEDTELELFHCTAAKYVNWIIKNNLDWRKARRSKFGHGVSFSPSASYANLHANRNAGVSRVLILAKVLIGEMCEGKSDMVIPNLGCETSCGNENQVYIKYSDNEFYPQYIIYYETPEIIYSTHRGPRYSRFVD